MKITAAWLLLCISLFAVTASAQTTSFKYQGSLNTSGSPANGNFDFEFALFDALDAGAQVGTTQTATNIPVANGIFTVTLDFGSVFTGPPRFLEIRVRTAGGGAYTTLAPRQQIASVPYSVRSLSAVTATNSQQLGGVAANQYVLTGDARLSDARTPTAGSPSYIQNTASPQAASNFNISGTGTVGGAMTAASFSGSGSGLTQLNAANISSGSLDMARLGNGAILNSVNPQGASFNIIGRGRAEVLDATSGFDYGTQAFIRLPSASTLIGLGAGFGGSGALNTVVGNSAGSALTTGSMNTFLGRGAGRITTAGLGNTAIGYETAIHPTINNATAIGNLAFASTNNSLVLGSIAGVNNATAGVNVGIGTSAPAYKLHVVGENVRVEGNTTSTLPRFSLNFTGGLVNEKKWQNYANTKALSFTAVNDAETAETPWMIVRRGTGTAIDKVEFPNGVVTVNGGLNYFSSAGNANFFMKSAGAANGINFGVVGNAGSNSTLYISQYDGTTYQDRLILDSTGNIRIPNMTVGLPVTSQTRFMTVYGATSMDIITAGGGTDFTICGARDGASTVHAFIAKCGISSIRYKRNVKDLPSGIDIISRLRPVTFNWKSSDTSDVGFIAEEVAEVEPQLTLYNRDRSVEGVRYEKVGIYLVKAAQEQQALIDAQQKQISEQQKQIEQLKFAVCSVAPAAAVCKPGN